ncbi:MAG: hypothetical protein OFPI_11910 [Osedax symbiont Rs2]|nr:MAG: hypothetical protein OFPI_11910 [Osedax symbiont Rs2]
MSISKTLVTCGDVFNKLSTICLAMLRRMGVWGTKVEVELQLSLLGGGGAVVFAN